MCRITTPCALVCARECNANIVLHPIVSPFKTLSFYKLVLGSRVYLEKSARPRQALLYPRTLIRIMSV